MSDLLENASQELSRVSQHIGFALGNAGTSSRLEHIDFASLEGHRVLVILVGTGGHITHKVVETEERYGADVLAQAASYLNRQFAGLTLHEARAAVAEQMRQERMLYDVLMARALRLARTSLADVMPGPSMHVQGASQLLDGLLGDSTSERAFDTLRALFRMLEEKHRLMELLTQSIEANGLTVVIGSEHLSPDLQPFSIVASAFSDGQRTGSIGVIGPTRMRYQRAIAAVDGMSQLVARVLEKQ